MSINADLKPFMWPSKTPFGMTVEKRLKVEECIRRGMSDISFYKELGVYPISGHGCFVPTDCKPLGSSKNSKVIKYYNPLSGEYIVGKEISNKVEDVELIYRKLLGKPHCVQLLGVARIEERKWIFFEPLYTRDLHDEIELRTLTPLEKIKAIFQVAKGVQGIHSVGLHCSYKDCDIIEQSSYLAHRDLKFSNIFVYSDAKGIRCDVGDYDCIPFEEILCGTSGYEPPEYGMAPSAKKEILEFNFKGSHGVDIWRLGIVFAGILRNCTAPFKFFKELSEIKEVKDRYSFVAKLRQDVVDTELDQRMGAAEEVLKPVWEMIKNDHMRIEPEKRSTIDVILKKIEDIQVNETLRLEELALEKSPYSWPRVSPFDWKQVQRVDIESQMTKYMSAWKPENGALFSFGEITEISPSHVFKYGFIYNNVQCFFDTNDPKADGRYYSPIDRKYYNQTFWYNYFPIAEYVYNYYLNKSNIIQGTVIKSNFILRPHYGHNLSTILNAHGLNTTAKKIEAMVQISTGVKHFHTSKIYNRTYNDEGDYQLNGPMSHRGLKLEHIFVKLEGDRFTFVIGGYANMLYVGEPVEKALLPPESSSLPKDTDLITYNHTHGLKIDMWQLGILFSSVLLNDSKPLSLLPDPLNPDPQVDITKLLQCDIDNAILNETSVIVKGSLPENEQMVLIDAWFNVRRLLQINPDDRIDIQELFKYLTDKKCAYS